MQCFAIKGRKQCPNEAVWVEHYDYEAMGTLIQGTYHCELCDECYHEFTKHEGKAGYVRIVAS